MKLVIKFPTRGRVNKFIKALDKYIRFLDDKSTKIIVSCDNDDTDMNSDFVKEVIGQYPNVTLCFSDNKSKIEAVNADLDDVDFDIILLASDDMIPMVKGYDKIIKDKMIEHYSDTDGVLWFNDGYQGNKLNTLCILGKKYYDRFGYIYNPEYISVWCDNEFMDVGNLLGKQTYFDEVIIKHEHPDWGFGNRDGIHSLNSKFESHDRGVYNKRKKINFEI
jgi:hypothetical protein